MLLIKIMLAYNEKYRILDESSVADALVASCTNNNHKVIEEILWIMAQIDNLKNSTLIKLVKIGKIGEAVTNSDMCLLPFLTIVANFLSQ